jgi:hypothetical protein
MSDPTHRHGGLQRTGVVYAAVMQDKSLSSDVRMLVALVSTFPRGNWIWRSQHLRSVLVWSRGRWQKVMREASAAKFVTVTKVSGGKRKIRTEYKWNVDRLKAAPVAKSIHRPGIRPTKESSDEQPGSLIQTLEGKKNLKVKEAKAKQGFTDVKVTIKSLSKKSKSSTSSKRVSKRETVSKATPKPKATANPSRSSRGVWSPAEWQQLREHLSQEQYEGCFREWSASAFKRDRGALRSLAAVAYGVDQACEKLEAAYDILESQEQPYGWDFGRLVAVATQLLERENGTNSSRHQQEAEQFKGLTPEEQEQWVYSSPAARIAMLGGVA